eukprot:TRINITY_DN6404_c0_g1_i1.p1 TRINITY_DN6404_c0_g1~~TRINITY_DN6404_c0_g1_i1.p1  ORF type:complete len:481 (+),score=144.92 TRINITY_DN6404_c0_g1_i1:70-1443(+)
MVAYGAAADRAPSVKVSYLTSSQYGGVVLHFFQTVEAVAQRIDNVHRQRRTFALVDPSDYSSDVHSGVTRCVAVSKIEQVSLPSDQVKVLHGPFTEFDVLCQGSSMLDFIRTIGALYSPHVPGNKMILLRLDAGADLDAQEKAVRCVVYNGQLPAAAAPAPQLPVEQPAGPATPNPKQGLVKSGDPEPLIAPQRLPAQPQPQPPRVFAPGKQQHSAAGGVPAPPPVSYAQLTDASPLREAPPDQPQSVTHVQLPVPQQPAPALAAGGDDLRARLEQLEQQLEIRTQSQKLTEDALNKEIVHLRGEIHNANVQTGGRGAWGMPEEPPQPSTARAPGTRQAAPPPGPPPSWLEPVRGSTQRGGAVQGTGDAGMARSDSLFNHPVPTNAPSGGVFNTASMVQRALPASHPYLPHSQGASVGRNPPPGHAAQYPNTSYSHPPGQGHAQPQPQPPRDSIWGF